MTHIEEIRDRLEKATPGPWIMDPIRSGDKKIYINQPGDSWERLEATVSRDDCDSEMALWNAKLIAAAPDDLAYLLSELDEAVKLLRRSCPSWNHLGDYHSMAQDGHAFLTRFPEGQ